MTVTFTRTVRSIVFVSQTTPGVTFTTIVGGASAVPAARLLPTPLGDPGQVPAVNDAGTGTEWVDPTGGAGGLTEEQVAALITEYDGGQMPDFGTVMVRFGSPEQMTEANVLLIAANYAEPYPVIAFNGVDPMIIAHGGQRWVGPDSDDFEGGHEGLADYYPATNTTWFSRFLLDVIDIDTFSVDIQEHARIWFSGGDNLSEITQGVVVSPHDVKISYWTHRHTEGNVSIHPNDHVFIDAQGDVTLAWTPESGTNPSYTGVSEAWIYRTDSNAEHTVTLQATVGGVTNPTIPINSERHLISDLVGFRFVEQTSGGGPSLSDADPAALGTADSGVATTASRSDHVHPMPSAAAVGAATTSDITTAIASLVTGPASATDGCAVEFDGTTGKQIKAANLTGAGGRPVLDGDGTWADNLIPSTIARDSEVATAVAALVRRHNLDIIAPDATVGTWTPGNASTSLYAMRIDGTAIVQNDWIAWDVYLPAGTWSVRESHFANSASGIATLSIGGVDVGTIDTYNAANTNNVIATIAGITVATAGVYRVKFTMATKNASSSGYRFYLQTATIWRTA